jgi:hypothetical protein
MAARARLMGKQLALIALMTAMLVGCSSGHKDDKSVEQALDKSSGSRYTSAQVEGAGSRINLDEVKKAFWETQGADMDAAMKNFERRVNEIYGGKEIVSVDAAKQSNGLLVVGFIDKNGKPGFQSGDDRLFTIEQTGQVANDQIPYRMSSGDGRPYYEGQQYGGGGGMGGVGSFMTGLMIGGIAGHMLGGHHYDPWGHYGGHYYTPYGHYNDLYGYRTQYRTTPAYHTQMEQNHAFDTRFRAQAPGGGVSSNRKFGEGGFSSQGGNGGTGGTGGRRWGGPTGGQPGGAAANPPSNSGSQSTTSGWGGRRSTSSTTSGSSSSTWSGGWGGRRSSSSSGGGRRRR